MTWPAPWHGVVVTNIIVFKEPAFVQPSVHDDPLPGEKAEIEINGGLLRQIRGKYSSRGERISSSRMMLSKIPYREDQVRKGMEPHNDTPNPGPLHCFGG
jgi:hypothetical protein